ncbi:dihydroneopterin aldolase [Candidatus Peregrinibacteria bacterium]|nr:dihydroneopterin aldolase [Candidatus Peregrinibacteria bacterium]
MADILAISDLELWTHIGVPELERKTEQRLLISVEMQLNAKAAAASDDVKKSINYFDLSMDLKEIAKTERKTIERFAEDAAAMIQKKYKPQSVTVTVKKFAVPGSDYVSISIVRP